MQPPFWHFYSTWLRHAQQQTSSDTSCLCRAHKQFARRPRRPARPLVTTHHTASVHVNFYSASARASHFRIARVCLCLQLHSKH